jgi:TPR repeat protein
LAQTALLDGAYADHLGWAEAGSMDSMTALGLMRQTGVGAERDDAKAFAWLRRAALRDHPRALAELGAYYAAGKATARDDKRALELFQRSAEFGSAAGRTGLGWAYLTGRGTAADPTQARQLFEAAAAEGDPVAALNLGRLYADGMGVARDETEAASWYAKAADQGSASAQYALALMLLERRTADPQNATLAAGRLQQAAAQGHPEAQRLLGALYAAGLGVPKDRATAQAWYDRAVAQTVSPATREAAGRALITLRTSS